VRRYSLSGFHFALTFFGRTLLYLQLIMQIQAQLTDASPSTNILKKPEHILMFVKHALEDAQVSGKPKRSPRRPNRTGLGLDDLRIVPDSVGQDEIGSGDSDDEDEGSPNAAPDEITVTTLNLLLALLEGELFRLLSQLLYLYWGPQPTQNCLLGRTLC